MNTNETIDNHKYIICACSEKKCNSYYNNDCYNGPTI